MILFESLPSYRACHLVLRMVSRPQGPPEGPGGLIQLVIHQEGALEPGWFGGVKGRDCWNAQEKGGVWLSQTLERTAMCWKDCG